MKITKLDRLKIAVAAQIRLWDALNKLERSIAPEGRFSDKADEEVCEWIKFVAAGCPVDGDVEWMTKNDVAKVQRLARLE